MSETLEIIKAEIWEFPCWICGEKIRQVWKGDYAWEKLPAQAVFEFSKKVPGFRTDFSRFLGIWYPMNHCPMCGAKIGDFFVGEDVLYAMAGGKTFVEEMEITIRSPRRK